MEQEYNTIKTLIENQGNLDRYFIYYNNVYHLHENGETITKLDGAREKVYNLTFNTVLGMTQIDRVEHPVFYDIDEAYKFLEKEV